MLSIYDVMIKYKFLITVRKYTLLANIKDINKIKSGLDTQTVSLLNAITFDTIYFARGKQLICIVCHINVALYKELKSLVRYIISTVL